jgi:hypothetical protein
MALVLWTASKLKSFLSLWERRIAGAVHTATARVIQEGFAGSYLPDMENFFAALLLGPFALIRISNFQQRHGVLTQSSQGAKRQRKAD